MFLRTTPSVEAGRPASTSTAQHNVMMKFSQYNLEIIGIALMMIMFVSLSSSWGSSSS